MKIEGSLPPRPAGFRKQASPMKPGPAASRPDHSFHSPDEIRVDVVMPTDADSHDDASLDADDDANLLSREDALMTAQEVGSWLARDALSLTDHHVARLQHLFAG